MAGVARVVTGPVGRRWVSGGGAHWGVEAGGCPGGQVSGVSSQTNLLCSSGAQSCDLIIMSTLQEGGKRVPGREDLVHIHLVRCSLILVLLLVNILTC